VLQHHRVPGQQRRHNRIYGAQVGVVPRRDNQHRAERIASDELLKAIGPVHGDIRQLVGGDRDHVPRPLLEATPDLVAAVAHRPAHLVGQLDRDVVGGGLHLDHHPLADGLPIGESDRPPLLTGVLRARQHVVQSIGRDGAALCVHGTVDRRDDLLHGHEGAGYAARHSAR
jgi:hypothetical protein